MAETGPREDERHPDDLIGMLTLSANLGRIYAQDESEKANISAIDTMRHSFRADAAALFYMTGEKDFRVCLAGTDFPISLPEKRWTLCVETHSGDASIARFGPWSLPGIEKPLSDWISARLYTSGSSSGFVFLGKDSGPWTEKESAALASIRTIIAPIIEIRFQRDAEEHKRREAELLLSRNESRLRDLFEGSRDMIYTADAGDSITSVNMSGPNLLGYPTKSDLIGKPFGSFALNPSDRSLFLERIAKDGYVDDYEIVLTKRDGTTIFCLETAHTLKNPSGGIRELQGIVKDITQRIEAERDLWRTNLQLAEANLKLQKTQVLMVQHEKLASIGQLAAGVAHEINNPLGFLISNGKSLEKYFGKIRAAWTAASASPDPALSEFMVKANLAGIFSDADAIFAESRDGFERIRKIVLGLKDFSRVDRSGDFDSYDVNAGIESTLVVAWNEIKYVSEIRKKFGALPLIKARGSEVNQVLLNILVNAAQAMGGLGRSEKGVIDIETRAEADKVIISIRDDGPGIPENIRNKIFDPFFTTKEPGKGTGLGLSISYDIIVNKHAGSLWVESEPGQGTTFYIVLPVAGPPPAGSDAGSDAGTGPVSA
ncbi:MAG: hypothetical protein A2Z99_06545 [Treponema sp. GWB1_62_6]|nr:MAG: hypothetical protein A2Z99_06545 [Treponema sp. GWB1_62_6]